MQQLLQISLYVTIVCIRFQEILLLINPRCACTARVMVVTILQVVSEDIIV